MINSYKLSNTFWCIRIFVQTIISQSVLISCQKYLRFGNHDSIFREFPLGFGVWLDQLSVLTQINREWDRGHSQEKVKEKLTNVILDYQFGQYISLTRKKNIKLKSIQKFYFQYIVYNMIKLSSKDNIICAQKCPFNYDLQKNDSYVLFLNVIGIDQVCI